MSPSIRRSAEVKHSTIDNHNIQRIAELCGAAVLLQRSAWVPGVTTSMCTVSSCCPSCWQGAAGRPTTPPSATQSNGRCMCSSMATSTGSFHFTIIVKVGGSEGWMYVLFVLISSHFTSGLCSWLQFLLTNNDFRPRCRGFHFFHTYNHVKSNPHNKSLIPHHM